MEKDPHGTHQHAPGAKLDAGKPQVALIFDDMPRALRAVADVATFGAAKYSRGGWLQVPDGPARYRSAGDRHRLARGIESHDQDSKLLHLAHEAWNRLAELELLLRASETLTEQLTGPQGGA
ncbi:DUF5664 domain-containing protein [Chromobacterium amazonense]|uniref:dATP/dGTP diphosphohydrolase domain-containing protein n=1 Tax=Chromobacterium amazonense TaxID=1382803 RepID=UPI00237E823E|nr:dATP/dGTP diphosphohydrolase domain-containing protein [Chromobacterium amazonense]MDE1715764.1 DUF5664 domain-containing protein [Chromobacterium amazonense]